MDPRFAFIRANKLGQAEKWHLMVGLFGAKEDGPIPAIVDAILQSKVRFEGIQESIEGIVPVGTMIQRFRQFGDGSFRDKNGLTFEEWLAGGVGIEVRVAS